MDKKLQPKTPLELTERARQRALEGAANKTVSESFGMGCIMSFLTLVALLTTAFLYGAEYIYALAVYGIPIVFIGTVIVSVLVKAGRATKNPPLEIYRIYQQNWVNQLLRTFLQSQYPDMFVSANSTSGILMREIEKPKLYLFDKRNYEKTRCWAGIAYSKHGIRVEADFCTWEKSINFKKSPNFKGIIYKIPYQQIYPDKITYIVPKNSQLEITKKLSPLESDGNTATTEFWAHFKVYSNDELHFQVLASNELIAYLLKLQQDFAFVAVTATANQVYLWIDWQKELCAPDIHTALSDTIDKSAWEKAVVIMLELAELAKNRVKL